MDTSSAPATGGDTSSVSNAPPPTSDANSASNTAAPSSGDANSTATPAPTTTEELKKAKYKLNVRGQEEEVEYDEKQVVAELQKARAAAKVREEAARDREEARKEREAVAQERAQFKQIVEALKNPQTARQLLRQIGTPLEELSKAELEDYIQQQQMTPEQRELHQLRQEKAQRAEQERLMQEQQARQEQERQVAAYQEQFAGRIVQAMGKLGLSEQDARASGEIAQKLAFKLEQALSAGYDLSPDELAEELREDIREQHRVLYGKLSGDQLFGILGEEGLKKAQQFATSRVPQVPSVDNPPKASANQAPSSAIPAFKSRKEWNEYFDSINNSDPIED